MPLPLREPFFLKGRTSVVQRAVIMSLVLGGLACSGGWCVTGIATIVTLGLLGASYYDQEVICGAWCVLYVGLIYAPLNFWNRRSVAWTLFAVPIHFSAMHVFMTMAAEALWRPIAGGLPYPEGLYRPEAEIGRVIFGTTLFLGLLNVRPTWAYGVSYCVSGLAAVLPALSAAVCLGLAGAHFRDLQPETIGSLQLATFVSTWMAALAVPWGIPFWWSRQVPESP